MKSLYTFSSFDGTTCIWGREEGEYEVIAALEGHENEVKRVCFSPAEELLATCGRDKSVWIWAVEKNNEFECVSVLQEHNQDVKCVVWHPTSPILVSCGYDDLIKLYAEEEYDWECYETLEGHQSTVWEVSFNSKGNKMVSCSEDGNLKVWTSVSNASLRKPSYSCTATVAGLHTRVVYSLTWNCNDELLSTGAGDNFIRIFKKAAVENENFRLMDLSDAHKNDVNCVRWHPVVPNILASCGDDKTIRIWKYQY
ncbi:probable cytosolic iron-sulfur protein assembly protein CIAO1 homolog [Zophobas morio]|uniref:probable cytosolic iron-sulfur protein assembly protein CIAO1 homolog n=1 Tax=Zophobas morio TaxID=2755281 RepID=UPI003083CF83